MLIAFEGLDQSGKETQAQQLRERLREAGHKARLLSFPDYGTSIGEEIARALQGEREYGSDVMQLLFVANRHERREAILEWISGGLILLCDRYRASSVAYGEAQGLDPAWLEDIQRFLPPPDLTIFIDIAPETAAKRKAHDRDRYERDLSLLGRVRESYRRQAHQPDWVIIDGEQTKGRDWRTGVCGGVGSPESNGSIGPSDAQSVCSFRQRAVVRPNRRPGQQGGSEQMGIKPSNSRCHELVTLYQHEHLVVFCDRSLGQCL